MELLEFLVANLSKSAKVWPIEELAEMYVVGERNISQDSIDFSTELMRTESSIKRIIKQQNDRYTKDGMTAPFLVKGTSHNLLTKTNVLEILEKSLASLEEDPHIFADRVGHELLRRMGCAEENIQ